MFLAYFSAIFTFARATISTPLPRKETKWFLSSSDMRPLFVRLPFFFFPLQVPFSKSYEHYMLHGKYVFFDWLSSFRAFPYSTFPATRTHVSSCTRFMCLALQALAPSLDPSVYPSFFRAVISTSCSSLQRQAPPGDYSRKPMKCGSPRRPLVAWYCLAYHGYRWTNNMFSASLITKPLRGQSGTNGISHGIWRHWFLRPRLPRMLRH